MEDLKTHVCIYNVDKNIINMYKKNKISIGRKLINKKFNNMLNIIENENGKPYDKNNIVYFNISDTNDYVCIAWNKHKGIGVDIEEKSIINTSLANKYFSDLEKMELENSEDYFDTFSKIWTRKEALAKLSGEGISKTTVVSDTYNKENDINLFTKKINGLYITVAFYNAKYEGEHNKIVWDFVSLCDNA